MSRKKESPENFNDYQIDTSLLVRIKTYIVNLVTAKISRPPRITILGPAGVGKSSTINALFGTDLPIGHAVRGSEKPIEVLCQSEVVKGAKGKLILYDMPGIDDDTEFDEICKEYYSSAIKKSDVAVWILSANDRRLASDKAIIEKVLKPANKEIVSRMIFGINKVDLIHPQNWQKTTNTPSKQQQKYLAERKEDITNKLKKTIPDLTDQQIVAYSAQKAYRLAELFYSMLSACKEGRKIALNSRLKPKDFFKQLDPEMRKRVEKKITDSRL